MTVRLLKVSVETVDPTRWGWPVMHGTDEIACGYETSRQSPQNVGDLPYSNGCRRRRSNHSHLIYVENPSQFGTLASTRPLAPKSLMRNTVPGKGPTREFAFHWGKSSNVESDPINRTIRSPVLQQPLHNFTGIRLRFERSLGDGCRPVQTNLCQKRR
jgi:hypothetical protein